MNIKNEIGATFYRVEYRGSITKLTIVDYKSKKPVYSLQLLTSLKNEEYNFIENPKAFGTSNFPLELAFSKPEEYFDNIEDAKRKSIDRFEKEVNPNGDYRVARYFDNVFECYVTGVLNKKEAKEKKIQFNKKPRRYVSYDLCSVNSIQ